MSSTIQSTLFFLLFFTISQLFAQADPIEWGEVSPADLAMTVYEADSAAKAVVLADYGRIDFLYNEGDAEYHFLKHQRIKILQRSGFDYADISIPFFKGAAIKNLKAQIFLPSGEKIPLRKEDFFTEKTSKNWSKKKFSFPNIQEGAIIEYQYTLVSSSILVLDSWYFQKDIPVRWSEIRVEIPDHYQYTRLIQGRPIDISEEIAYSNNSNKSRRRTGFPQGTMFAGYRMVMKEVPALKEEPYVTTMDNHYSRVRFQLSAIKNGLGYHEPIYSSWDYLAERLYNHSMFGHQINRKKNHKKIMEAVEGEIAGITDQEAMVKKIYTYFNKTIKAKSEHSFLVPTKLDDCFENKTATTGELNLMMVAVLKELGISSHPVLISTRSHGKMFPIYPFLDQFNHVLALATIGDKEILIDLGDPHRPIGYPSKAALNKMGWKWSKKGSEWIAILPPSSKEIIVGNFELKETGGFGGTLKRRIEGYPAVKHRANLANTSDESTRKNLLSHTFLEANLSKINLENTQDIAQPFLASMAISVEESAMVSGDKMYFTPILDIGFSENPFKAKERSYPVEFTYPIKDRQVIGWTIPVGWKVEELPKSQRFILPNEEMVFEYKIYHKQNSIRVNFVFELNQLTFEPAEYDGLKTFFDVLIEKIGEQVVLTRKE